MNLDERSLIIQVECDFFRIKGRSSLSILGPWMVDAGRPVGLLIPNPRPRHLTRRPSTA